MTDPIVVTAYTATAGIIFAVSGLLRELREWHRYWNTPGKD